MEKTLVKEFVNPGSDYRGAPFWAWNGKLEPEELRRQIRLMHKMGLGGFFMHSRVGLDTAYLADDWFKCVDACIDEAEKMDMNAWLYDEDRWPSGVAGGLVTKNPKYRTRFLVMNIIDKPAKLKWNKDSIAAFTAVIDKSKAFNVRQISKGKRPARLEKKESILHFYVEEKDLQDWYNGYTYLDTLSKEAVQEFIRVTHEAYRKRIAKHFGKRIPGIFTDEPAVGHFMRQDSPTRVLAPWTGSLPDVFKKKYGYDLIPHLPKLFFDVEGREITPARWNYYDCVTYMFVQAFSCQIGEWCGKNNMQFTGHVLSEDSLSDQTTVVGSAMRFYEYMQAPGMDLLTEHWRVYDTAKQVSSMAHQFGRKWRLTETYGCTGWDFPFMGHKAEGDWQAALGINIRCQHLSWYTMLGEAKRDYPASIFYQSPWWEQYPKVEDYFARIYSVITRGTEVRDLLVIHPVESMWVSFKYDRRNNPDIPKLDSMFVALRDSLNAANIDFDYGEEEVMSRHGSVSRSNGKPVLRINKASYKAVIVPPMKTIRSTTLRLLEKFRKAGGVVVFAGKPSEYVDAEPSLCAEELAEICVRAPEKGAGLAKAVESLTRRISITDANGRQTASTLHMIREDKDNFYLFVCNTGIIHTATTQVFDNPLSRDRKVEYPQVKITGFGGCAGQPVEMDTETGAMYAAKALKVDGKWEVHTALPRLGSRLFCFPKRKSSQSFKARKCMKAVRRNDLGGSKWDIKLSENNCLVLDRAQYRINSGKWEKNEEILRIDRAVRTGMGISIRKGDMIQPWARPAVKNPKRVTVDLLYVFEANALPTGDLFIALERPETFKISVNGQALSMDAESGWWCDRSLRKIPVDAGLIRLGKNEVLMTCDYDETHSGFEIAYLLGTFGTDVKGTTVMMTDIPSTLKVGDWVKQGLAFYSGSVSYCRTIKARAGKGERVYVSVPEYRGVAVRVLVDGKSAGVIGWEPNEIDITDMLDGKPVELRVEVIGHRRNSHGPFHLNEKWPTWTGPDTFTRSGKNWFDGYQLVPCGLMKVPQLVYKKERK